MAGLAISLAAQEYSKMDSDRKRVVRLAPPPGSILVCPHRMDAAARATRLSPFCWGAPGAEATGRRSWMER